LITTSKQPNPILYTSKSLGNKAINNFSLTN